MGIKFWMTKSAIILLPTFSSATTLVGEANALKQLWKVLKSQLCYFKGAELRRYDA